MAIEWDEIAGAAAGMFRIWTSGGDLVFAKECWGHLSAAGFTNDDGVVVRTETYLRLIAVHLVCAEFCAIKWHDNAETEITYLAEDLDIDMFALGYLAYPHLPPDSLFHSNGSELRETAILAVAEALQPETFDCIREAFDGDIELFRRMSRIAGNYSEDEEMDVSVDGNDVDAFAFVTDFRKVLAK